MQKVITLSTIFLTIFMASCATTTSYKPSFLREYIIDVPQGNVLEQDKISQLHSGQHKDQVKFLIGSPMLNDVFHKNRWDYVFQYRHGKTGEITTRQFTLFFDDNDLLVDATGDVVLEKSHGDEMMPKAKNTKIELGKMTEEQIKTPLPPRTPPTLAEKILDSLGF